MSQKGFRPPVARDSHESEHLLRGKEGNISAVLAFGWFAFLLGRETLPPLLPTIISDLSITEGEAGLALSVMWAAYALCHYPGGRLSDRLTRKTVLVPSILLTIGGFALLSAIGSFAGMITGVCLLGAGGGAYYTANRGLLADTFVDRRAGAFGVQIAAGSVGSALASGLAIAALAVGTWQIAFAIPIVLLVFVVVALNDLVDESYRVEPVAMGLRATIGNLMRPPKIRRILVIYVLFAFVWQGTMAFLPAFLQAEKGFSTTIASVAFASLYVVGIIVAPVAGNVGDRLNPVGVAAGALLVSAIGLAGLLLVSATALVFASVVVFALGIRSYPPVMQAFVFSRFSADSSAGDFGALKTVYTGIGSLGPLYVGFTASSFGYDSAFSGYAILLVINTVLLVALFARGR